MPGATIIKKPSKYEACQKWNANKKLGQAVAFEAMDECMRLADKYGVSAERIRQLEARALSKLREAADEAKIDVELGA